MLTKIRQLLALTAVACCGWLGLTTSANAASGQPQGCTWHQLFDIAGLNFAYPDLASAYFTAFVPKPAAGQKVLITGNVPDVRYFSFSSYDLSTAPYDTINDFDIAPDNGAQTPFLGPAQVDRSIAYGAPFTLTVDYGKAPAVRAANTLYAKSPLPPGYTIMIYRTYAPLAGLGSDGGVGLPTIVYEDSNGQRVPMSQRADCPDLLNVIIKATGREQRYEARDARGLPKLPQQIPGLQVFANPPPFQVFYNLAKLFGLTPSAVQPHGEGFFTTQSTTYAVSLITRDFDDVYLVRGKAANAIDGSGGPAQLRYWSICQYDVYREAVVACTQDNATQLDADGYYTVVIADAPDRPSWATAGQGFTWLPWGRAVNSMVVVRNMLPASGFAQAFQNIQPDADPYAVSGDYFPRGAYCSAQAIKDAAGLSPAQVFARCAADAASGG